MNLPTDYVECLGWLCLSAIILWGFIDLTNYINRNRY